MMSNTVANFVVEEGGSGNTFLIPFACEVLFFPDGENVNAQNDIVARRFFSNGDRESYRMKVHIEKSIIGQPNESTIQFFNLSQETITYLNRAGMKCIVRVNDGTYNVSGSSPNQKYTQPWTQIYSGGVTGCMTERVGPDIITTVYTMAKVVMYAESRTILSRSAGSTLVSILEECATRTKSTLDATDALKKIKIGLGGFTFQGNTIDILNKLAFQYGFVWSFDGSRLICMMDTETTGRQIVVNARTGLITATPLLYGPFKYMYGTRIKSILYPKTECGDVIMLESSVNPSLNDKDGWRVHTLVIDVSPHTSDWTMEMNCFRYKGFFGGA